MGKKRVLSSQPIFKGLFIVVFPLLLAGCAPPAVQIASWVVDGILYVTTGKSAPDHAISVAMKKDCAMWRVVKGVEICSDLAPAESDDILVAMGDDETLSQDDLDAIAERLSTIETAAGGEMAPESSQTPEYRGVQTASLSFGRTVLSPRKKHYELSADVEATATDTTTAEAVDGFPVQAATESADDIQGDFVSPIVTAVMSFGRPVAFADGFIQSLRKRNRLGSTPIPATQPFGRPVHSDFSKLPEPAPEPAASPVPERAKLPGVNTSFRDSSDNGVRQLAALSIADDSLFSVTSITKKPPAVSPKISTVVPAIKPAPAALSRYLVLGSFRSRDNADAFSKKLGAFKAFVSPAQLPSGTHYRVLAAPSSGESLEGLKSRYNQTTGVKGWVVTLSGSVSPKTAALR